jgi:hypothetical protein
VDDTAAAARVRTAAERYGWLLVLVPALLLAYLVVWQRGLYADDYAVRTWVVDPATGGWRPLLDPARHPFFPVRPIGHELDALLAALLLVNEPALRVLAALGAGANALLLAALARRLTGSPLAAAVSGWLFAVPLFAFEAVLWTVGNAHYVFPTTLALLSLHAYGRAVADPVAPGRWTALATVAFAAAVASIEQFAVVVFLVPLLPGGPPDEPRRIRVRRRLAVLAPAALVALAVFGLFAGGNRLTAARGGIDANPFHVVQRLPEYAARFWLLTLSPEWGLRLAREAWARGAAVVGSSGAALGALAVTFAGLLVLASGWRGERSAGERADRAVARTLALGLLWLASAYVFPSILIREQASPSRLLYFPIAGASLALGAAARLATPRRRGAERVVLVACAAVLAASAVGMLGYASAYAERSRLDRRQIAAFRRAVPAALLPPDVWLVPVATEERLSGTEEATSRLLSGVFETSWSAAAAIELEYRRTDIHAVAGSRWSPARFAVGAGGDGTELRVQNVAVPLERALVFTYQGGAVLPIESLRREGDLGALALPVGRALAASGAPTIGSVVVRSDGSVGPV